MSESSVVPQESPLSQRLEQLDRQIADTVQQVVQDLHREVGERVRQSSQELVRRLEALRPTIPEAFVTAEELMALVPPPPGAPPEAAAATDELLEAIAKVDAETGQAEVLVALLEQGRRFASRTAFFLIREGQARGWAARGFEAADQAFGGLSLAPAEIDSLAALVRDQVTQCCGPAECQALARRVNAAAGRAGVVVPFMLRGQLSGALYGDRVEGEEPPDAACLQLLLHATGQALETASFRAPGGSPALRPIAGEKPEALAPELPEVELVAPPLEASIFDMPAALEPVVEEPDLAELAPGPEYDFAADEVYAGPELEPADEPLAGFEAPPEEEEIWAEDDDPTVIGRQQAPPAPPVAPEAIGQATVRLDVSALQEERSAARLSEMPLARPAAEQTAPMMVEPTFEPPTESEFELEPSEEIGFELEPEPPILEAPPAAGFPPIAEPVARQVQPPTQVRPPSQVQPPSQVRPSTQVQPPADMVAPAPPSPPARTPGGTEVSPPTGLRGPGLAFATQTAGAPEVRAGEEAKHEEARRLARLLVSEIKLYNEEVIEEGRRAGNIYSRLKEDIDRSRQMYQERIDASLQGKADYFYQELVQRLAGGDPKLLGL